MLTIRHGINQEFNSVLIMFALLGGWLLCNVGGRPFLRGLFAARSSSISICIVLFFDIIWVIITIIRMIDNRFILIFFLFFVVCPFSPFPYPLVWPPPQSHQMNHQISQGQEEHDRLNLIFYRHQVLKTNTWTFAIRIPLQSSVPQNEIDSVKTRPTTHYLLNLLKTSNFLPWLRCKQVSLGAPMTQKKAARLLSVARDWKQAVQAVHSRSDWD